MSVHSAGVLDAARQTLDRFYGAMTRFDGAELRSLLRSDVFVFSPTATGVLTSADQVIEDLRRWTDRLAERGAGLELNVESSVCGVSAAGTGAWVFDRLGVTATKDEKTLCRAEIRLTALLARDDAWRIAAAYWSTPYPTQDDQDRDKHGGRLEPGIELVEALTDDVAPFASALSGALAEPRTLPDLYSTAPEHVTLGSVVDEVFLGAAGRAAWAGFVEHVTAFELRGPMRGAMVGADLAWLAANIEVGAPPTPYRFFYVWTREADGWRICVSHDAVSRDPLRAGVSGE